MYYRVSIAVKGRDGFETDGYGRGWAWKLRYEAGTGLEAMGVGRGRVRHLSPCSSLFY